MTFYIFILYYNLFTSIFFFLQPLPQLGTRQGERRVRYGQGRARIIITITLTPLTMHSHNHPRARGEKNNKYLLRQARTTP